MKTAVKVLSLLLLTIFIVQNVQCDDEKQVNMICWEYRSQVALCQHLIVNSSKSTISKVLKSANGPDFNTTNVTWLSINNHDRPMEFVQFVPAAIKEKFPDVTKFEIIQSGLTHLQREDMEQFGADLIHANFWKNSLTAIEGDLFEFNQNLKYIGLHNNLLKFIDPKLFLMIKKLKNLEVVEFLSSNCINSESTFSWDIEKCNDQTAQMGNLKRIKERETFFSKSCLNQCDCNNTSSCNPHTKICMYMRGCVDIHCKETCPNAYFGKDCLEQHLGYISTRATCDKNSGEFKCRPGLTGPMCEFPCKEGFFGENCTNKCICNEKQFCSAFDGCSCELGWIGDNCEEPCIEGSWGESCIRNCYCLNETACQPNDGSCICQPGFYGANCTEADNGQAGQTSKTTATSSGTIFISILVIACVGAFIACIYVFWYKNNNFMRGIRGFNEFINSGSNVFS